MSDAKKMTVSEFKTRLGLTTKMVDRRLKARFAKPKLRKFGLTGRSFSPGAVLATPKRKFPGGFLGVVIGLFILSAGWSSFGAVVIALVHLNSSDVVVPGVVASIFLSVIVVGILLWWVLKEKLFFRRYKIGLMKYLGNEGGEYPHRFVVSIPDETKAGFSIIHFRNLKKTLHVNDVIASCKEVKTGNYNALIYLAHGDASGLQSYLNDSFQEDLLPGLKDSDLEMIAEFSELADLYLVNAHLVTRGHQVNAKVKGQNYISTDLTPLHSTGTAQVVPAKPRQDPPEIPVAPPKKGNSFDEFEKKVNEQAQKDQLKKEAQPTKDAKDPYEELAAIIGLGTVKQEIVRLKKNLLADEKRRQAGVAVTKSTLHFVFTGNPGTGKTTVARILGRVLKEVGVLKNGSFTEVSRSTLVAGYIGQTAPLVDKAVDQALGGVLFIDEAYSLVSGGERDFGQEAITQLLKRMEDDRENLVVIVAGYVKEMDVFLKSNSGLESRFTYRIDFPDYSPEELGEIFQKYAEDARYQLGPGVLEAVVKKFESVVAGWNKATMGPFSNGRHVRNYFDECVRAQGNRLVDDDLSGPEATRILLADLGQK